jgi:hypothetical protein
MTRGVYIDDLETSADQLCQQLDRVRNRGGEVVPEMGWEQYRLELLKAEKESQGA